MWHKAEKGVDMDISKLSLVKSCILILGETGTGKTTLARQIHEASNRSDHNFISVNLAGLSDELFLSELFGHRKGSFTGAYSDRRGYCDYVGRGTLFLDEIGDLSLIQQKYLLKLIDEKRYTPVGDHFERDFAGTIIMATHKDLEELVQQGLFREDLYFRIRIFTKNLLPMRDLKYELPQIIKNKFVDIMGQYGVDKKIDTRVMDALVQYDWPGNYRELKNTIEFILTKSEKSLIEKIDLPDWIKATHVNKSINYYDEHSEFEKNYLIRQLALTGGKINETARKVGLSKVTLIAKIKKYTIDLEYIKIISQNQKIIESAS